MSEGYFFEDSLPDDDPAPSRMDRRLKWLIIILSIVLGGELIWVLVITPCMPLSVIEISGVPELDRGIILTKAGIGIHSSYMTVDTRLSGIALGSLYQIESARVVKQFPDTVRIYLEPRKAVAMSLAQVNGRIEPVFFDKYGVVFKIGNDENAAVPAPGTLPLISGLVFEPAALGARLPAIFHRFLADLSRLNSTSPELLAVISEIHINRRPYDGFELILYPVYYPVRIRIGTDINQDMLRYMFLLIDVFIKQGVVVDEVDFRTGTASYIKKEASVG
jgi:cell division protein FtsQ